MVAQPISPPRRDLPWLLRESTPFSIGIALLGGVALVLATVGTVLVLVAHGVAPVEDLIRGFRSNELTGVALMAVLMGVGGMVLGWGAYQRMPTKVSREEAIAGAVLGLQAVALGSLVLWLNEGNVDLFARNYLDFEVLRPEIDAFVNGAKNTVILAFSAEAMGIILGLTLAMFAISRRAVVRAPARVYINFFRGTPLLWQIIFIGVGIPIGLSIRIQPYQAAIIALTLNAAAYLAEVFRAGIQSIERGQLEAARGLGMSYLQAMRYAVIPQAIRRVIPPLLNEFVILIKDTSLVIVLGLTQSELELMSVGDFQVANTANATPLIATALGYLAVTLPLIRIVNGVERRLRSGLVGVGA
jgi:His/Glu/Gln/Arg/opine family amino acid ABC transporter permease subunit